MTRIFTDGAEFGDGLFWNVGGSTSGQGNASTTQKRSGAYGYYFFNASAGAVKNITGISEFYLRFGLYIVSNNSIAPIIRWRNSTTELGSLRHDGDLSKLKFYTSTSTLVATSNSTVGIGAWYLIEIYVNIADSGNLNIKIDGTVDAGMTFAGDTKPGTATTVDNLMFVSTGTGYSFYIDDLALNNVSGGVDDSWPGDGHIIKLTPNANGDSSTWVGSDANSTDNYLLVDDIPASATDYVEASSSGDTDLYNLSASGLSSVTIHRVWPEARAADTVAEGGQIYLPVKAGTTQADGTAVSLLTTYTKQILGDVRTVNPDDSAAWEVSDLDSLQAGVKVV